ncbi:hypothetical protein C8R46DRAFT_1196153 [Mycena filopes]|nr:hypothetical protein C8R46DRAFT_1196153 [Mycena filopes]
MTLEDTDPRNKDTPNNIHISRMFGAPANTRFTIDPNIHIPASLLTLPQWAPATIYCYERRKPNMKLYVAFAGLVDVTVHLLAPTGVPCAGRCGTQDVWTLEPVVCSRQSSIEINTITANINVHVTTAAAASFSIRASSTFGQIRVHLPRTFHGPLTISASFGTPCLSKELAQACMSISEVGGGKRWFVGDLDVWRADSEHGDTALIGTSWGRVWIGYEGEDDEGTMRHGCVMNVLFCVFLALLLFWVYGERSGR